MQDPFHGGTCNGNACNTLLKNVDSLRRLCPIVTGLRFVAAFHSFKKVVDACFSYNLDGNFLDFIIEFKSNYLELDIPVTPKVHAIFFHVPAFCLKNGCGLGRHSEQPSESVHASFELTWSRHKVNSVNPAFGSRLFSAVIDYNSSHM